MSWADNSNNEAVGSFKVNVTYARSGALQPINPDGTSVFKLGSTVPVKFEMTGVSKGITNAAATISLHKASSTLPGEWVDEGVVSTAASTSGSAFRYDATSDQYIFNLGTKNLLAGTFRITINYGDGTTSQILFGLRK